MLSLYTLFTILLLAFLLAVFFLLVIPLDLSLALQLDEIDFRGRATLKWLFFSYGFSIEDEKKKGKGKMGKIWGRKGKGKVGDQKKKEDAGKVREEKKKEEALETRKIKKKEDAGKAGEKRKEKNKKINEENKSRDFSFYLKVFRALYIPLFRFCTDVLRIVTFREFDCFLAFGFENPADTGISCGFLYGLKGLLKARCARCRLDFSPNFLESELKVRGKAEVRIRPYRFGFAFLKFIFDRRTLGLAFSIFSEEMRRVWPKV